MCLRSGARRRRSPVGRWLNRRVHARVAGMRRRLELRAAPAVLPAGGATMADVARRLGVAKPTLYKLAGSREELLRACVEAETERLLGHLHAEGAAELAGVVRAVDAYERDSPGGFRLLRGPDAAGRPGRGGGAPGGGVGPPGAP